ncbi:MAG: OmpA family protein [Candidatus Kapabacteria bacterium]|nr:OmpA family protein [Candidatus Kapabacteria bacterium]
MTYLAVALTACCVVYSGMAQSSVFRNDSIRYGYAGLIAQGGLNLHSAQFGDVPDFWNCSPGFTGTTTVGFQAGLTFETPLQRKSLPLLRSVPDSVLSFIRNPLLTARVIASSGTTRFATPESTRIFLNGEEAEATFNHTLDITRTTITGELFLGEADVWKSLSVHAGIFASYSLSSTFSFKEEIVQPAARGVFPDVNRRTRAEQSGTMQSLRPFGMGASFAIGWQLPLDNTGGMFLRPELTLRQPFWGAFGGAASWSTTQVMLGVSVFHEVAKPDNIIPADQPLPAIKQPLNHPVASWFITPMMLKPTYAVIPMYGLRVLERIAEGNDRPADTIRISGYYEKTVRPLLNYVFFDVLSSEIPQRYKRYATPDEAVSFSMKSLFRTGMLETYYHILNIIAVRMMELPDAKITITGCNMGNETEGGKTDLSRKRAEAVRDYLTGIWKIDETRIKIKARNRPEKASAYGDPDGDEENRRVEITSNIPTLLEPVFTTDTMYIPTPDVLYAQPVLSPDVDARAYSVNLSVDSVLKSTRTDTTMMQAEIELPLNEVMKTIRPTDTELNVEGFYALRNGMTARAQSYPVYLKFNATRHASVRDTAKGKNIEKYSLILFDYDDASYNPSHEGTLALIRSSLTPDADVYVNGYTDRMGEDDYNQRLSDKRARAVAKALGGSKPITSTGLGESIILYNNNTPEGRFYCRTIEVRVEKPTK